MDQTPSLSATLTKILFLSAFQFLHNTQAKLQAIIGITFALGLVASLSPQSPNCCIYSFVGFIQAGVMLTKYYTAATVPADVAKKTCHLPLVEHP